MQTIILNTYNSKTHSNISYTTQSIIEIFNQRIKRSLHHFMHAMKQNSYTPSRWGCLRLPLKQLIIMSLETNWKKTLSLLVKQTIPNRERDAKQKNTASHIPTKNENITQIKSKRNEQTMQHETKQTHTNKRHDKNQDPNKTPTIRKNREQEKESNRHHLKRHKNNSTQFDDNRMSRKKRKTMHNRHDEAIR